MTVLLIVLSSIVAVLVVVVAVLIVASKRKRKMKRKMPQELWRSEDTEKAESLLGGDNEAKMSMVLRLRIWLCRWRRRSAVDDGAALWEIVRSLLRMRTVSITKVPTDDDPQCRAKIAEIKVEMRSILDDIRRVGDLYQDEFVFGHWWSISSILPHLRSSSRSIGSDIDRLRKGSQRLILAIVNVAITKSRSGPATVAGSAFVSTLTALSNRYDEIKSIKSSVGIDRRIIAESESSVRDVVRRCSLSLTSLISGPIRGETEYERDEFVQRRCSQIGERIRKMGESAACGEKWINHVRLLGGPIQLLMLAIVNVELRKGGRSSSNQSGVPKLPNKTISGEKLQNESYSSPLHNGNNTEQRMSKKITTVDGAAALWEFVRSMLRQYGDLKTTTAPEGDNVEEHKRSLRKILDNLEMLSKVDPNVTKHIKLNRELLNAVKVDMERLCYHLQMLTLAITNAAIARAPGRKANSASEPPHVRTLRGIFLQLCHVGTAYVTQDNKVQPWSRSDFIRAVDEKRLRLSTTLVNIRGETEYERNEFVQRRCRAIEERIQKMIDSAECGEEWINHVRLLGGLIQLLMLAIVNVELREGGRSSGGDGPQIGSSVGESTSMRKSVATSPNQE